MLDGTRQFKKMSMWDSVTPFIAPISQTVVKSGMLSFLYLILCLRKTKGHSDGEKLNKIFF